MRLAALLCGLIAGPVLAQTGGANLVGLVRDSAGARIEDVEITLDSTVVLGRTDPTGRFTVPGLAPGPHTVRFEKPGLIPMELRVEITGDLPDAEFDLGGVVLRASPAITMRVSISFSDALTGRPVEGVVVSQGRVVVGYADRAGRYRTGSLAVRPGAQWSFRRLGYQPLAFDLWPDEGQESVNLEIRLKPAALELGPVIVEGDASRALTPWLREFEERRRRGWGSFLTQEEAATRPSQSATNLLSWVGVTVKGDGLSGRGLEVWGAHCWPPGPPVVFLDGMRLGVSAAIDWLDTYSPDQVAGIEVYNSPAEIPSMFNMTGSACGVIVVWTKR